MQGVHQSSRIFIARNDISEETVRDPLILQMISNALANNRLVESLSEQEKLTKAVLGATAQVSDLVVFVFPVFLLSLLKGSMYSNSKEFNENTCPLSNRDIMGNRVMHIFNYPSD